MSDPQNSTDAAIDFGYVPSTQSSTGTFVVIGMIGALIVGGIYAAINWERLSHSIRPSVETYDEERDDGILRVFMERTFPKYIIAVSKREPALRQKALEDIVKEAEGLPRLVWHAGEIDLAIDAYEQWAGRSSYQDGEDVSDVLKDVNAAFFDLDETLREMHAPYAVDAQVRARRTKKGSWRMSVIARTSEIWRRTTFRAGETEVVVSRQRRLDGLSVVDTVHGKVKNGVALVLVENAEQEINGRYLPALADGLLRDYMGTKTSPLDAAAVKRNLKKILPPDIRDDAEAIGAFANERRALLEELSTLVARNKRNVRPWKVRSFLFGERTYQAMKDALLARGQPEMIQRLGRFRHSADGEPELLAKVLRAHAALLDAFLVSVERHEAWHMLQPNPTHEKVKSPGELLAYIGAIANAYTELPIVLDKTLLSAERFANARPSPTKTGLKIVKQILTDLNANPRVLIGAFKAFSIARLFLAIQLRKAFGETRNARRTHIESTRFDPYIESLIDRPEKEVDRAFLKGDDNEKKSRPAQPIEEKEPSPPQTPK